jgi:hypothetical protein
VNNNVSIKQVNKWFPSNKKKKSRLVVDSHLPCTESFRQKHILRLQQIPNREENRQKEKRKKKEICFANGEDPK